MNSSRVRVLIAAVGVVLVLAAPSRAADVSKSVPVSLDSSRIGALLPRLDSITDALGALASRSESQDARVERFYDKTIQQVYWVFGGGLLFLSIVAGLLGVVFPMWQQRSFRKDMGERLASQTTAFDAKLQKATEDLKTSSDRFIQSVKLHSENLSIALTSYVLGAIQLNEARNVPFAFTSAFAQFVDCLSLLSTLLLAPQLPRLYEACLLGIVSCAHLRWGQLQQQKVDQLRGLLEFLKNTWKHDPGIAARVRDIETWLNRLPDDGIYVTPPR